MATTDAKSHQLIGSELNLFNFNEISPGSCFFLPKGAIVYNKLKYYMLKLWKKKGYEEVITPNIFSNSLFKKSGHWGKYRENIFTLNQGDNEQQVQSQYLSEPDKDPNSLISSEPGGCCSGNQNNNKINYSLKPMNCPGHCIMFKHLNPSYRDLPIRLGDFGALHRNELKGALRGLTRVRKFSQDDAHIFCREDQINEEVSNVLKFIKEVYDIFNFETEARFSTRPEKYIGSEELWDKAEDILEKQIVEHFGVKDGKWKLEEGDGAFYGPKISVYIKDSLNRMHQCATVQLDFNLPERFKLKYKNDKGEFNRPVIIHRAIYGSIERFMAILLEHTCGKLPYFVSPRNICIVPIHLDHLYYCDKVRDELLDRMPDSDIFVDRSDRREKNKIREAYKLCFNYILVIGKREIDNKTVNVNKNGLGEISLDKLIDHIQLNKHKF